MIGDNATRLPQLYRFAHNLLSCKSKQEALETSLQSISHALQASSGILWEYSADKGVLKPTSTFFQGKAIKVRPISPGADFLGEAYRSGKPSILKSDLLLQPNKHLQSENELTSIQKESPISYLNFFRTMKNSSHWKISIS
jgi:hypothetical protein